MVNWSNGEEFESEVRRIARALWGAIDGDGGASIVDGRERDCLFKAGDITHYIECTRHRTLEKVRSDSKKMVKYRDTETKHGRLVKLWIVTEHEPTADQQDEARNNGIVILSLHQFERQIIDADAYLEFRKHHRFGSATDPDTDSHDVSNVKYQPTIIRNDSNGDEISANHVADMLTAGKRIVLLGDYGMGKSVTLREVFTILRKRRIKGETSRTPILLNLREHWGQRSVAEALERHGREIGFSHPTQLIRALHLGKLIVMLDGFDELASIQWTSRDPARMREARRTAVALVKAFADKTINNQGFIVAGRDHFFDNRAEMDTALGLKANVEHLVLDGFSLSEMREYLAGRGFNHELPDWLPNRPLLLGYLSRDNMIGKIVTETAGITPSQAWDSIVTRTCEREANIHQYLDADSVRRILEILASTVRDTASGLGPVSERHVFDAFRDVTGMDADEAARPLLMRLPGLSTRGEADGGRSFLDDHMLDVLRTSDLVRFAQDPHSDPRARNWVHCIGPIGIELATEKIRNEKTSPTRQVVTSCQHAVRKWGAKALAIDLMQVARSLSTDEHIDFEKLTIAGATIPVLDLSEGPIPKGLHLKDLIIHRFHAPESTPKDLIIQDCLFETAFGIHGDDSIPEWITNCTAVVFDGATTNADILRRESLPIGVRVALTVLRKLFIQHGHGRKENALSRGMSQEAQRRVGPLLSLIASERIAFSLSVRGESLWHPIQGQRRRVQEMIDAPMTSRDPFLVEARML